MRGNSQLSWMAVNEGWTGNFTLEWFVVDSGDINLAVKGLML